MHGVQALIDTSKVITLQKCHVALQHIIADSEKDRSAGKEDW